jgi:hypothetical protein
MGVNIITCFFVQLCQGRVPYFDFFNGRFNLNLLCVQNDNLLVQNAIAYKMQNAISRCSKSEIQYLKVNTNTIVDQTRIFIGKMHINSIIGHKFNHIHFYYYLYGFHTR